METKPRLTVIDADSIIWTVAYKYRNKRIKALLLIAVQEFIESLLNNTQAKAYIGFLGSKQEDRTPNFRHAIVNNYKANRPEEPDWLIKWRPVITKYLIETYKFVEVDGMEADDACSIAARNFSKDYTVVIASPDKDLKQIPDVYYYDYRKNEEQFIDRVEACRLLGEQVLKGDSGDNIKGLPNVGKVKARNLLKNCNTETEIKWTVLRTYAGYREELYNKVIRKVVTSKREEIKKKYENEDYTAEQIERFVRIESNAEANAEVDLMMPGGWKTYIRQQFALVKLLETHDVFELPEPIDVDEPDTDELSGSDKFMYMAVKKTTNDNKTTEEKPTNDAETEPELQSADSEKTQSS